MPMNHRILRPLARPLLLDAVPGAAAAYSLRQLSNSYTGPVVTVRRSSDNAEADFTAAEVADGTLAAFCGAGDGFVRRWWDQSGNARHASQSTAGSQPQIVGSGVVLTENGKPALLFDGAGDELATGSFATGLAASVFAVVKANSWHVSVNYDCIFSHGYTPATQLTKGVVLYLPATSVADWSPGDFVAFGSGYDAGSSPRAIGPIANGSDLRSASVILSASASTVHINGGALTLSSSSTSVIASVTAPVLIGSSALGVVANMLAGKLSELLYYDTDQTANRQLIEGDLAWYY
jgi:hypothetical protein